MESFKIEGIMRTNRKKVLVIGEVFYPEDFLINDLVSEWIDKGYDVEVLARVPSYPYGQTFDGYKNRIYQKDHYKGATVHRVGFVQGYKNSLLKKILNYILFVILGTIVVLGIGRKFERLFIYHTGPLTLALPGMAAKKLYGVKTSIWTQDLWPDTVYAYGFKKTGILDMMLCSMVRFVYKNCDNIFVTCQGFTERIQEFTPGKEVKMAPNWPITQKLESPKQIDHQGIKLPEGINFTFTGNVGKVQNLENVIAGFGEFRQFQPDANLNIVGDGSNLEALKELVREKGIGGVTFWGRYPVYTMTEFYKQSDVLVLSLIQSPIFELTIPMKFQTYLTAGKPIFGIIKGDVADMIEEHNLGYSSDPENIQQISHTFCRLTDLVVNDPLSVGLMSVNCKLLLENKFDRESIIEDLSTIH